MRSLPSLSPKFDSMKYTVHAVEDIEYIMCVFQMNDWDKEFYKGWNLHLPFFSKYSDGFAMDRLVKVPIQNPGVFYSLSSWDMSLSAW